MDGIHDLGGRHGFGGSLRERDDASFHAAWERRVFAMFMSMAGYFDSQDQGRHALERLDPVTYLTAGYYGRWLVCMENLIAERGGTLVTPQDARDTARRDVPTPPRFAPGDAVRTRVRHAAGHTRLPGYARGRRGTVILQQGGWVLPDTNAHGQGECPEHVYAVRFEGRELWGDTAEPTTCVHLDLFESYLEPS